MIRIVAAAVVALLLAAAVVRNAAVSQWATSRPALAGAFWSSHPDVERTDVMTRVGVSARTGAGEDAKIRSESARLAVQQPLAVEPYLIAGVAAELAGSKAAAERLFNAAHRRDVRSIPAHYFLADLYLSSNRLADGLREFAHLGRLSPGGLAAAPPYLAQFARSPANWPAMRSAMAEHPELADPILNALASDPRNSETILALADARHRRAQSPWLVPHISALLAAGQYERARRLWLDVVHPAQGGESLIYDAGFADPTASPPFNWDLASSGLGLAERRPGGALEVIFYGSQSGPLARQLLVLRPGTYTLEMKAAGTIPDPQALTWVIRCAKGNEEIAVLPITKPGAYRWSFSVPTTCPAQWIELDGRAQDVTMRTEITVSGLALTRGGRGA